LLLLSLLLSLGPVLAITMLKQGRAVVPPPDDPSLRWTGSQAQFISLSVQAAIGALCWIAAGYPFIRILRSGKHPAAVAGVCLLVGFFMYALLT